MSEVRRRVVDTVRPADGAAGPLTTDDKPFDILQEGHKLYAEAEKTGFNNAADLTNGLQYFLRAAVQDVDEAMDWISSFLDSTSALPPTAIAALQPSLLHLLRWVQTATSEEKAVYLVAEGMFRTMSHGDSTIPRTGFDGAVQNLLSSRYKHSPQLVKSAKGLRISVKRVLSSCLESNNSAEVTMEMFCESAVTYARGVLPHEDSGELTAQQMQAFKEANILKKVTNYPVQTAHFYKHSVLKLIERRGMKWIWSSFPTKQFYLLLLAYFLPMISAHFILSSLATAVFVAALIAMCVGTLQIMLAAEKVFSFIEYSSIFQYFSEGEKKIDMRKPEARLIRRSVLPCVTFGASFCTTLLTFYLSHQSIIPNEAVCIVSAFFTLVVFFQFECYKSPLFLLSSSSRLLSWLYVFLMVVSEILPIPEFLFYIGSAAISIPVFPGLSLRINTLTLVQFPMQCMLIIHFIIHNKWCNFYSGLGPYLLFTSWWVMTRHFFILSSPFYLFLGTFGIVIVLGLSPFMPILFLASPMYVLFYHGLSRQFFMSLGLVVCSILFLLLLGKFSRRLLESKWLNVSFDSLILLQILVSIPVILVGASWVTQYYSPTNVPVVSLAQYNEYCSPGMNWVGNNMVQTQLNCMHLRDRMLMASGRVKEVKIREVSNTQEQSLQNLPRVIRAALTCLLGRLDPMCGHRSDMDTCRREFTGCHFYHNHEYTFAVYVDLNLNDDTYDLWEVSVVLLASNSFTEVVRNLRAGDNLQFNATFVSGMGSDQLVLQLAALEGVKVGRGEESMKDSIQLLVHRVSQSLASTVNILLDVLLGFSAL